jgi:predicted acetyltransferase
VYAWGFYLDGILVGMMQIDTIAVRTGAIGIVVNKAFRNRGVGRKILALIFHEARALGMQRMIAEAEPENVSSLRCLTAAGFVQDSPVSNEDGYLCFSRNL